MFYYAVDVRVGLFDGQVLLSRSCLGGRGNSCVAVEQQAPGPPYRGRRRPRAVLSWSHRG